MTIPEIRDCFQNFSESRVFWKLFLLFIKPGTLGVLMPIHVKNTRLPTNISHMYVYTNQYSASDWKSTPKNECAYSYIQTVYMYYPCINVFLFQILRLIMAIGTIKNDVECQLSTNFCPLILCTAYHICLIE